MGSKALHDFTHNLTTLNIDMIFNVMDGTETFYLTLLNHGSQPAAVYVEVISLSTTSNTIDILSPALCGQNAVCAANGWCTCNQGYKGDPFEKCSRIDNAA